MKTAFGAFLLVLTFAAEAIAGECKMTVTRAACPGKEGESYAKCNGQKSCDEVKKVGSAQNCAKEALKACDNIGPRQKITKTKTVSAQFNGGAVEGGRNFCAADRSDFNKCD